MSNQRKCRHGCRCTDCGRRWCADDHLCPQCRVIRALRAEIADLRREVADIPRVAPHTTVIQQPMPYPATWITAKPCPVCGQFGCTQMHVTFAASGTRISGHQQ